MHHHLPESFYVQNSASNQSMVFAQEKNLWELGQRVISYARDVLFLYPRLKAGINETNAWQYVSRNGAGMLSFCITSETCSVSAFNMGL